MTTYGAVDNLSWLDRSLYGKEVTLSQAEQFCRTLAHHHYENFTVVSFLLPRRLRQHFCNVYAYCRMSDDLADELQSPQRSLDSLEEWRGLLRSCYRGEAGHPVFVALRRTVREFDIPIDPFENLLDAFCQDQVQTRYPTWADLLGYCRNSANPVGRLVLYLCGIRDAERQGLSDATCTALQLTNFWQDVARDYAKGRVYIPLEMMRAHGYTEHLLSSKVVNSSWVSLMKDLIGRTFPLFHEGLRLVPLVPGRVRLDIELFSRGGMEILRAIESADYDTLNHRPALGRWTETRLIFGSLMRAFVRSRPGKSPQRSPRT